MKKLFLSLFYITGYMAQVIAQNNNLDFYIKGAISNSPLLKDYKYQISSNKIDSALEKANYKPHINVLTSGNYAPVVNGYGYDPVITNGGAYSAMIAVNQTIVGRGNIAAQLQSLQLLNESLKNTIRISEQDLKKSVTEQYIAAYGDLTQYNLNKQIVDLFEKENEVLKKLVAKGIYRQTDYLTFLVSLQQQQLGLKQLSIQYKNNIGVLNYLCGITDTSFVSLSEPFIQVESLPSISNSSFFKQFTLDSLKLVNHKLLVDFNYHPKLNFSTDGGFNSSFTQTPYKNFGGSLGFNLAFPIYDGNQRKLQYSKIEIADKTRIAYKDFFASQYKQEILQLIQQLRYTEELIVQINTQISYSEALILSNRSLLQTGDARISDYLIAITTYLNIKNQLTLNTINRLQLINQINYWNR